MCIQFPDEINNCKSLRHCVYLTNLKCKIQSLNSVVTIINSKLVSITMNAKAQGNVGMVYDPVLIRHISTNCYI